MKEVAERLIGAVMVIAILAPIVYFFKWTGELFRASDLPIYKKAFVGIVDAVIAFIAFVKLYEYGRSREERKRWMIIEVSFDWSSPVARICRETPEDGYFYAKNFVEDAARDAAFNELKRRENLKRKDE